MICLHVVVKCCWKRRWCPSAVFIPGTEVFLQCCLGRYVMVSSEYVAKKFPSLVFNPKTDRVYSATVVEVLVADFVWPNYAYNTTELSSV